MLFNIKDKEKFINQPHSQSIKKKLNDLRVKKNDLLKKIEENEIVIKNSETIVLFWNKQNEELVTKIVPSKIKINELEKQKVNKVRSFFTWIFSFGKKDINKNIVNLIKTEKTNYQLLKKIIADNKSKIDNLNLDKQKYKDEKMELIINFNEILKKENELLIELNACKTNYQESDLIKEVDEKMVKDYEEQIFLLNERVCELESKLSFNINTNSINTISDEGFDSKTKSTNSLRSNISLPKKLPTKSLTAPKERTIKPWEQTLREYGCSTKKSHQKKPSSLKI